MTDIYDKRNPPSRDGLESHQVWVWMNGPGEPHWEVRGTGVVLDKATVDTGRTQADRETGRARSLPEARR